MLGPQSRNTSWIRIKWHHCQGPLRGHESVETPIGNESNGAIAGEGANFTIRDSGGRLVKREAPHNKELELSLNIMETTPEDQHSHHGHQDNPNKFRSMRDPMHPPRMSAPSCIVRPTEQLVIRPHIVPLLPTFHGMERENPYAHIKEFEDVCNTFREEGASIDLMRLKLFPFTLKDKAKIWLNSLRQGLKRMRNSMSVGKDTWKPSMLVLTMVLIHGCCKNPEEDMDFLSYVAEVSRGWDESNKGEVGKMKSQLNAFHAKAGMYTLNEDVDMKAKFAAMTRRLEELELKKMHEVQVVAKTPVQVKPCFICQSYEQLVEECPTIPVAREMFGDQANVIGQFKPNSNASYGNTYNSSWRNHSNFSWKPRAPQYQQPAQPSQQASSLEQAIVNLNKIDNLQYSISRLTNLNTVQEKGRFPSQPHQNPKGIDEVETHERESSQGIKNASEILEVLRQVKVNIPLLDMIKQVPTYAKFLKDLCTIKRGLNVNKKAFLTEQVSAIIQCKSPLKYKDLGCPTISVMIGERPFLATSNAIINCRNGLMQLTFGNMTLELNIFYMSKKLITPEEEEDEAQEATKEEIPKLNLKSLPMELKYTYLEENNQCPVVISSSLTTSSGDFST
ncbi:hypothetical protein CK203_108411 [Vitis vinifera]|uniref:Retrotransposon gag domain-containing protein n=1 Tax=Vitis vinifera TaxID=29760 RepID=A0A438E279_VITVI|nr:hypothetical protein CK203_108411 [Vitis vinifera]